MWCCRLSVYLLYLSLGWLTIWLSDLPREALIDWHWIIFISSLIETWPELKQIWDQIHETFCVFWPFSSVHKYIILSKMSQTIKSLPGLPSPPCRPCPAPGLLPSLSTNLYPSRAPILTSLPKILVLMFYSLRRNIITSSTLCYWPLHAERERREK